MFSSTALSASISIRHSRRHMPSLRKAFRERDQQTGRVLDGLTVRLRSAIIIKLRIVKSVQA